MSFRADSTGVACCVAAANHEPRRNGRHPDLLLLHYTGMLSAAGAVDWLTRAESKVKPRIGVVNSDERSFYWRLSGRENLEFFASLYDVPRGRVRS